MMQVYCKFLNNDGYCAKGKYCEFSHDREASKALCKAFIAGKCIYGKSCSFSHTTTKSSRSKASSYGQHAAVSNASASKSLESASASQMNGSTSSSKSDQMKANDAGLNSASAWGFDNDDKDDGVYFYGAPGTFPTQKNGTSDNNASYAGIAKSKTSVEQVTYLSHQSHHKPKPICSFFLSGTCKFGSFCRNSHEVDDNATELPIDSESHSDAECGICISTPEDGMYGLSSNCDCVFCLKCIRGWRKEGVDVVKDNQQVRRCPLCRMESYFICPSSKALYGESKQRALEAYKLTLNRIPCKHYQQGQCPFGSSCFYRHVNRDGTDEVTVGPRVVLNASAEPEFRGNSVSLFNFIAPHIVDTSHDEDLEYK